MSYYKDDYGNFGCSYDDYKQYSSSRDRDHERDCGRSYEDDRHYSTSRDHGRSYVDDRQYSSSHDRNGGYSKEKDQSRDNGHSNSRDPLFFAYRDNLLNDYIDKRVRIEVFARKWKTHIYIGTMMAFDLELNLVLADCYRLHQVSDKFQREDVKGLLLLRGSRVHTLRRERNEPQLNTYMPPPPAGTKKLRKMKATTKYKLRLAESLDAAASPTANTIPMQRVKPERSWKLEGGEPAPSGVVAERISELKIKEEPVEGIINVIVKRELRDQNTSCSDDDVLMKRETRDGNSSDSDDVIFVKREPQDGRSKRSDDSPVKREPYKGKSSESDEVVVVKQELRVGRSIMSDGVLVKREPRDRSSESDDVIFVKQEARDDSSSDSDDVLVLNQEPRDNRPICSERGERCKEALNKSLKREMSLEEFLNTSDHLTLSEGEISE